MQLMNTKEELEGLENSYFFFENSTAKSTFVAINRSTIGSSMNILFSKFGSIAMNTIKPNIAKVVRISGLNIYAPLIFMNKT